MPSIPEAFKRPATVTHHQVDDHDAPGGTDLEAQLLQHAGDVPPSGLHPAPHALVDDTGLHFPARQPVVPSPAEVARREPFTAPQISLEILPDSSIHNVELDTHVRTDETDNRQAPMQTPLRQLVTTQRVRVAGQVTLDGTGAGTAELTPAQWGGGAGTGAGVQQNQRWLLDRVVARGGAAGTVLIYAGASGNDQDLVAVLGLGATSFGAQQDGNPVQLNPGWRVTAVFAAAGNNLVGTAVAYYRVMVYAQGWETDTV